MGWRKFSLLAAAVVAAFGLAISASGAAAATHSRNGYTSAVHHKHAVGPHKRGSHRAARVVRGKAPRALHVADQRGGPHCRRHHACRHHRELREAYAAPTPSAAAKSEVPATAPPVERAAPQVPVRDPDANIAERERDVPIILSVASTLRGYRVEHAVSIIEVRDANGDISYRLAQGAIEKRTQDSAELAEIELAPNERLIADLHSHPLIKASLGDGISIAMASQATQANFYPGIEDYNAVVRRGVVSAIIDPDGGVMLLRRIAGAPSIRKIDGEPLVPLDEAAAERLDVPYLYAQGYLSEGEWQRPAIGATLHAGP